MGWSPVSVPLPWRARNACSRAWTNVYLTRTALVTRSAVQTRAKTSVSPLPRVTLRHLLLASCTETSGTLGPNQYLKGAWDRSGGQDSSEDKQICRINHHNSCVHLAALTATTAVMRHPCLSFCLSCPSKRPHAFAVPIPTQFLFVLVMAHCPKRSTSLQ